MHRRKFWSYFLTPSEEMLEALGMRYPRAAGFRVLFTGVSNLKTSEQFRFFEAHEDLWCEVLHDNFEQRVEGNACQIREIFYDKRRSIAENGNNYGEADFEYNRAFLE